MKPENQNEFHSFAEPIQMARAAQKGNGMDRKEEIMEAVIAVFTEKGARFTMDDVARHLHISKRTMYTIVREKEELLLDAVDYVFAEIKKREREIADDTSLSILERLQLILIAMPQQYEQVDFRMLVDVQNRTPKVYERIEQHLENGWELTISLMNEAMRQGYMKQVCIPVFQAMFSGTIEYYLKRSVLTDMGFTYEEGLKQMLSILLEGTLTEEGRVQMEAEKKS